MNKRQNWLLSKPSLQVVGLTAISTVVIFFSGYLVDACQHTQRYLELVRAMSGQATSIHQVAAEFERLALQTGAAWAYWGLGYSLLQLDQQGEAQVAFGAALSSRYHIPVTAFRLGQSKLATGDRATALDVLRRIPNIKQYYQGRGDNAFRIGDWGVAEDAFSILSDLDPTSAEALVARGNVFYSQERWDEAYQAYAAAISFNPDLPIAHYYLGMLLIRAVDTDDQARYHFQRVIELNPDFGAGPYLNLGLIFRRQGDHLMAGDFYQQGVERFPGNKLLWLNYAVNEHQRGEYQRSQTLLDMAESLDNAWSLVFYWQARNHYALGEYAQASESAEQANRLGTSVQILNLLGDSYQALGQLDVAKSAYARALDMYPGNAYAAQRLRALLGR